MTVVRYGLQLGRYTDLTGCWREPALARRDSSDIELDHLLDQALPEALQLGRWDLWGTQLRHNILLDVADGDESTTAIGLAQLVIDSISLWVGHAVAEAANDSHQVGQ